MMKAVEELDWVLESVSSIAKDAKVPWRTRSDINVHCEKLREVVMGLNL
jgi:hypothetical protein